MTDLRTAFEADLHAAYLRRDFDAWNTVRIIYADYLEEQGHWLYPMARAACTMIPRMVGVNSRGQLRVPRVELWRLYFALPADTALSPRWAKNRRMNRDALLGFPHATLRCMGIEDKGCGMQARFTLTFKPRTTGRHDRGAWRDAAFDTVVHAYGFPRMFWPTEWSPAEWSQPRATIDQPTLLDGLEAQR